MAIERARKHLASFGLDNKIIELEQSSATVALAAAALGVEGARIAKSLSFMVDDAPVLVVAAGDIRVDNRKFKEAFHVKAKMLTPEQTETLVGHAVGGVCPFGVEPGVKVYLDVSLKRFDVVYPACGSANSAIPLTLDELYRAGGALGWVDVAKDVQA